MTVLPSPPAFAVMRAQPVDDGPPTPLVFASPHSGGHYPDDMDAVAGLSEASLRSAEDALVDRLIASGPAHGAALVTGQVSRGYVDLNRAPEELDPSLIADCPPGERSAKVTAGFGVIPRRAGDGAPLYDRTLALDEARGRLDRVHAPYHAALAGLMEAARAQHGVAVLVDWHSMPSRAVGGGARGGRTADVILGDRHGSSCSARLTRRLRALFEGLGWRVGLNQPYAGGYSTQLWGRPGDGFQAVQVELNRALYLDEATLRPSADYARCQKALEQVIAALCAESWPAARQA